MEKIRLLDRHLSELIAAGEVVERPASVVKEMTENSIDAGASAVTVEIKNGGISFIRIADNGSGILKNDVKTAFLRHATSKISNEDDLYAIRTLGFRGEALASVSAVSRVELLTKSTFEKTGTRYKIEGGQELLFEDAGCPNGSTFIIRDLFYNTPARMKFLKKDVSEANAVAQILDRIALSHPEISLKFIRDGKEQLHTPGDGNLKSAIYSVFGREFVSGLIEVGDEQGGIGISGFVSKPAHARPNRNMQHFFINGRYVKTKTGMAALEEALKHSIMVGRHPSCVLNLHVPFDAVDVNVHPAKIEVKFSDEKRIFDTVYYGVKNALHKGDEVKSAPLDVRGIAAPPVPEAKQLHMTPPTQKPVSDSGGLRDEHIIYERTIVPPKIEHTPEPVIRENAPPEVDIIREEPPVAPNPQPVYAAEAPAPVLRFAGEAFGTYIILESGADLLLVDKHAGHERLIYEKLKESEHNSWSQMLLTPVTVTLSKEEYSAVVSDIPVLESAGFEMSDFGSGTVVVHAIPVYLDAGEIEDAVSEIAESLINNKKDLMTEKQDRIFHSVACRGAIKAGDKTGAEELTALVARIISEGVMYCPHGRPVFVKLTRREIEKLFGRV